MLTAWGGQVVLLPFLSEALLIGVDRIGPRIVMAGVAALGSSGVGTGRPDMAVVLGLNAVFHDPAAALVVDGRIAAAAEKAVRDASTARSLCRSRPGSCLQSASWCLSEAGLEAGDVDVVTYSYEPRLVEDADPAGLDPQWEHLRTLCASRAPGSSPAGCQGSKPGGCSSCPTTSPAASAHLAAPFLDSACSSSTAAARPRPTSVGAVAAASSRCSPRNRSQTRSASVRGGHRSPRFPPVERRVQGDGAPRLRRPGPLRRRSGAVMATEDGGFRGTSTPRS